MSQEVEETKLNQAKEPAMDKAKKNLVYMGMFSVFMLFAGFTSAYIVSMGDNFWVKAPLPKAFWISTVLIVLSSVAFQLAIAYNKKGDAKMLKLLATSTLILGMAFVYFQFKGYGQLMDNGLHFTGSGIAVGDGRYGDFYTIKMDDDHLFVNGNDYLKGDKILEGKEMERLQSFMEQFLKLENTGPIKLDGSENFKLYYRDSEMIMQNGELLMSDSTEVKILDRDRLTKLARNVVDGRGDFFMRGELGKDFHIFYKGSEVTYKDRNLYHKGKKMSDHLNTKILESADTSSSYLYLITFMHLLHIMVTLIYLIRVVIRSFTGPINRSNSIGLKMGALFWHFLGLLWVYLLLFLLFIH